ncbi:hypothetical protein SAMN05216524_102595 [Mucilaginibacter sp. OK098]|nr:hypothetical protein SAMN05216524_102595 [Mucilaginibacter sp. OK098]
MNDPFVSRHDQGLSAEFQILSLSNKYTSIILVRKKVRFQLSNNAF